jgi:hypothetical protein
LLSSKERPGTGSATHSSMGVPLAPNPLNRSAGLFWFMAVVGAFCRVWDPATEFGSVARQTSAPIVKSVAIKSFTDFMYFPPEIWAVSGPIEERLLFEAGLI